MSTSKQAVLLLAHGSPDSVDEIPEFLLQISGGRPLSPEVIEEVQHRYGLIGRSPLTVLTLQQGSLLRAETWSAGLRWHAQLEADIADAMKADDRGWR